MTSRFKGLGGFGSKSTTSRTVGSLHGQTPPSDDVYNAYASESRVVPLAPSGNSSSLIHPSYTIYAPAIAKTDSSDMQGTSEALISGAPAPVTSNRTLPIDDLKSKAPPSLKGHLSSVDNYLSSSNTKQPLDTRDPGIDY